MPPLAPSSISSNELLIGSLHFVRGEQRRDQLTDVALLCGDAPGGIDDLQTKFVDDAIVLLEDFSLEDAEAFDRAGTPAHIHPGLVELQLHAPGGEPVDGDINRHSEIERQIRSDGEAVQLAHPLPVDAAG